MGKDKIIKKKIFLFIILLLSLVSSIFSGCNINSLELIEIRVPSWEIGYQVLKIDNANPRIIYDNSISHIELIFNQKLLSSENLNFFTINNNFCVEKLSLKDSLQINGSSLIINIQINKGITLLLIPSSLTSINGAKLKDDKYIYFLPELYYSHNSNNVGVQKIVKRKGDNKNIGFALVADSLPQSSMTESDLLQSFKEIPIYDKVGGKQILSLKNGDGFEIINENNQFCKIQIFYKKDLKSDTQKIQGFIDSKYVFKIPEPQNNETVYTVFAQQFLCVVAKKFMNNVPSQLPYFPYIQVTAGNLGDIGVELLEQNAIPLTENKMAVLELMAVFNGIIKPAAGKYACISDDARNDFSKNALYAEDLLALVQGYSRTLLFLLDKMEVTISLIPVKQKIANYINLKSNLLLLQMDLLTSKSGFVALASNYVNSFNGDIDTKAKLKLIEQQVLEMQHSSDITNFRNLLNINIFKPIEDKINLLFDNAFFPKGNWLRAVFKTKNS